MVLPDESGEAPSEHRHAQSGSKSHKHRCRNKLIVDNSALQLLLPAVVVVVLFCTKQWFFLIDDSRICFGLYH